MKVTIISGARPNFMKIAPLCRAMDAAREAGKNIAYRIVYTGPHDDPALEPSLFADLAMPQPDAYLGVSGHDHSQITADIMLAFEKELEFAGDALEARDDEYAHNGYKTQQKYGHRDGGNESGIDLEPKERDLVLAVQDGVIHHFGDVLGVGVKGIGKDDADDERDENDGYDGDRDDLFLLLHYAFCLLRHGPSDLSNTIIFPNARIGKRLTHISLFLLFSYKL